jgi:hypothetical protein
MRRGVTLSSVTNNDFVTYVYREWPLQIEVIDEYLRTSGLMDVRRSNALYVKVVSRLYALIEKINEITPIPNDSYRKALSYMSSLKKGKQIESEEKRWLGIYSALECAAASLNLWTNSQSQSDEEFAHLRRTSTLKKSMNSLKPVIEIIKTYISRGPLEGSNY